MLTFSIWIQAWNESLLPRGHFLNHDAVLCLSGALSQTRLDVECWIEMKGWVFFWTLRLGDVCQKSLKSTLKCEAVGLHQRLCARTSAWVGCQNRASGTFISFQFDMSLTESAAWSKCMRITGVWGFNEVFYQVIWRTCPRQATIRCAPNKSAIHLYLIRVAKKNGRHSLGDNP